MAPSLVAAMIAALVWGIAAGLLARAVLLDKPGRVVAVVAGLGGSALGYLVGHELLGRHDMHLFAAEALLPSTIGALALLRLRSLLHRSHRTTIFG